tara:strand:- start:546 stop:1040 length:495 start_codon:yes stop_codon:yes gene_type:complete
MIKEKINNTYSYYKNKKGCAFMLLPLLAIPLMADEIKFQFKSPSFSGIGTSAHYLTIENQEYTRKEALEAEIQALKDELERDAENTTLARFIRNFESRIYAQLSRQLVEQLFGENPADEGSFTLFDNIITWTSDGTYITLTIYNETDGTTTEITIPIGDFGFAG